MFAIQLALSALVWAGVVYALVRRRERLIEGASSLSRGRRLGVALALLAASLVVLFAGLAALAAGGLTERGLTAWGWAAITFVGSAFIVLQTAALVPLVLNAAAVTPGRDESSKPQDADPL